MTAGGEYCSDLHEVSLGNLELITGLRANRLHSDIVFGNAARIGAIINVVMVFTVRFLRRSEVEILLSGMLRLKSSTCERCATCEPLKFLLRPWQGQCAGPRLCMLTPRGAVQFESLRGGGAETVKARGEVIYLSDQT